MLNAKHLELSKYIILTVYKLICEVSFYCAVIMRSSFLLWCIFTELIVLVVEAKNFTTPSQFIIWKKGRGRIIITAPHGGRLRPLNMPDRLLYGCLNSDQTCSWIPNCKPLNMTLCRSDGEKDKNTLPIALKLYEVLTRIGLSPHLIINKLHRIKLDVNRPIEEAAQGNEFAESVYHNFHEKVRKAQQLIKGRGLYLDIHGQSHAENWTEISYRIPQMDLVCGNFSVFNSSIRALAQRTRLSSVKDLIIGPQSFGSILERRHMGYKVTPSFRIPKPHFGETRNYYEGGYNTMMYGSLNGGLIDGIQVEVTADIRLKSKEIYERFATDLAITVSTFMKKHKYFDSLDK